MKLYSSLITLSAASLLSACIVIATPTYAKIHSQQELVIDSETLKTLEVNAGAGSLAIRGQAGINQITVKADIYSSSESNDFQLSLTQQSKTAHLEAHFNHNNSSWQDGSSYINLEVIVPQHMLLDVTDGSGNLEIRDIQANVTVKDGSGGMTINNITGNLLVNDGSGQLVIEKVIGDVNIDDGSGSIVLANVKGQVVIDDGSGNIALEEVIGDAYVNDGSGDLSVKQVSGLVTLDDGSGDIEVYNVGGLKVLESGSGSLRVKEVEGVFEIDSE